MTTSILFQSWSLNDVFLVLGVIASSAIVLYLLSLLLVTLILFKAFWASLEDQDSSLGSTSDDCHETSLNPSISRARLDRDRSILLLAKSND